MFVPFTRLRLLIREGGMAGTVPTAIDIRHGVLQVHHYKS